MEPKSQITDELLTRFLEAKGVRPTCPCCGSTQWHRLHEPLAGFNYKIAPAVDVGAFKGIEIVVIYCMNCGFVRPHVAHLMRAWEEKQLGS